MNVTLYELLGVKPEANPSRIEDAYRTACAVVGGQPNLPQGTRLAYRVLSTPERRQAYEELLQASHGEHARPIPIKEARFYKLAAEEWGFEWSDTVEGTLFRHVGIAQSPLPEQAAKQEHGRGQERPNLKLHDYLAQSEPKPERQFWRPKPLVLGERVFHFRAFSYTVQDVAFTSSHMQLHLQSDQSLVFDLPELVNARGIRPGCSIMFCGLKDSTRSSKYLFTNASVTPYVGSDRPVMFAIHGLIDEWFAAANRGVLPRYAKKGTNRNHFCRVNFGVRESEFARIVTLYELATNEAALRYEADWLRINRSEADIKQTARAIAMDSLKNFWRVRPARNVHW